MQCLPDVQSVAAAPNSRFAGDSACVLVVGLRTVAARAGHWRWGPSSQAGAPGARGGLRKILDRGGTLQRQTDCNLQNSCVNTIIR